MLIENDITISCAESLTGGMFASTLVDNADISKVFDRGLVTYTDRAKIQELDVEPDVLAIHGAVSKYIISKLYKSWITSIPFYRLTRRMKLSD